MRKQTKILLSVFSPVLLLGIGAAVFYVSVSDDLKYTSIYTKEGFTLKDIAGSQIRYAGEDGYSFAVKDGASVYDSVAAADGYLYSLDSKGGKTKEDTGMFLLHKNNTYVYVDYRGGDTCYIAEPVWAGLYFPYAKYANDDKAKEEYYEWDRLMGIRSFEDLVEYYRGIDSALYKVDEANKLVFLRSSNSQLPDGEYEAVIKADATGVTIVPFNGSYANIYSCDYWLNNPAEAAASI